MDPKKFRTEAAKHADRALSVAAEIMDDPELSPAVRLEASKWLTKVADLEPKSNATEGNDKFSIIIHFGDQPNNIMAQPMETDKKLDWLLSMDESHTGISNNKAS